MLPDLAFFPPIIAHRGASARAPENTLAAIKATRAEGATWVEFDVKITADGVPILMHDETLDRTTGQSGAIASVAWEKLRSADAGCGFAPEHAGEGIPHLTDALTAVLENDLGVIVEIKPCPGRVKATTMVAMIEIAKVWPEKRFFPVIASFDMECLEIAAQLEPPWPRCLLMDAWDDSWEQKVGQIGASAISLPLDAVSQDKIKALAEAGIASLIYAVSAPDKARDVLAWGASAVYSDNPRAILDVL